MQQAINSQVTYLKVNRNIDLTHRELEVLEAICSGLNTTEIGKQLYIANSTVTTHKKNLYKKFAVNNAVKLMLKAIHYKLVII